MAVCPNVCRQIQSILDSTPVLIPDVIEVDLVPNLRSQIWVRNFKLAGIKTGVLSNMPLDLAAYVRTNGPLDGVF